MQLPLELTEATANVFDIGRLAAEKLNISKPVVLNCNFEKINDHPYNRGMIKKILKYLFVFCFYYDVFFFQGELFWNRRFKFYVASHAEWKASLGKSARLRGIVHPIERASASQLSRCKSSSMYWPVTLPRTFRRSFTRMKLLKKNNLLVFKHVKLSPHLNFFCFRNYLIK